MNEDAYDAVIVLKQNVTGLILEHGVGYAKIRYTDLFGILHEEYLPDEDYEPIEEWMKED